MDKKITIIEFYKQASNILNDYRIAALNTREARKKLEKLNTLAEEAQLGVKIPETYLTNVTIFDDEMSYEDKVSYEDEVSYSDDTSYESDDESD